MLEVPSDLASKELCDILEEHNFSLKNNDPIPMEGDTKIYFIEGPKSSYLELQSEMDGREYKIWSDSPIEPL